MQTNQVERLICHGYEMYPDGSLSKLCDSVCRMVSGIHSRYDQILLLAGMHLKKAPTTVDRVMEHVLIAYGVPAEKIVLRSVLCPEQRPPRTTMEEVDAVASMLREQGCHPRGIWFDVVCIWYYGPMVEFLYNHRGAKLGLIHGAPSSDLLRRAIAGVTYVATRLSPTGEGRIYDKIRADRDVFPRQPDGQPWVENLPDAWDA